MKNTSTSAWNTELGLAFRVIGNNPFTFQFFDKGDMQFVLDRGPWSFNEFLLLLNPVNGGFRLSHTPSALAPFWIVAQDFPMGCRYEAAVKALGNRIDWALVRRVTLGLGEKFAWIGVQFMRLPILCYACGSRSHQFKVCSGGGDACKARELLQYGTWPHTTASTSLTPPCLSPFLCFVLVMGASGKDWHILCSCEEEDADAAVTEVTCFGAWLSIDFVGLPVFCFSCGRLGHAPKAGSVEVVVDRPKNAAHYGVWLQAPKSICWVGQSKADKAWEDLELKNAGVGLSSQQYYVMAYVCVQVSTLMPTTKMLGPSEAHFQDFFEVQISFPTICGFSAILGTCSAPMSDMWGVFFGLEIAWNAGFKNVWIELDSELVLTLLQRGVPETHQLSFLAEQCHGYISKDFQVRFTHTYREANRAADFLAYLGFSYPPGLHHLLSPPKGACTFIIVDIKGTSFPRFVIP